MSRWLKNVNALLENLDSQVEETVEEHRFSRFSVNAGGDGVEGEGGVAVLLQEEAQGVDDILAKRGLLQDDDDDEGENKGGDIAAADDDEANDNDAGQYADALIEQQLGGGDAAHAVDKQILSDEQQNMGEDQKNESEVQGGITESNGNEEGGGGGPISETINFDGDSSSAHDGDGNLFGGEADGNDVVVPAESNNAQTKEPAPSSANQIQVADVKKVNDAPPPKPKQAPSSSNLSAPPKSNNQTTSANAASLKELRKLRRHVLQLNSDLESAEREMEAQRAELDRAASRMERDRSRHKQEKESMEVSHKAEVAALVSAQERAIQQLKETNESVVQEMEGRVTRAEQQRAKEGGERDIDLANALERERASLATTARLQEEKSTMNERITSLTADVSRLETRLEHATSQMELASERERNAEEQLDKALSLHARQLGMRQRRESELEQTVADLGAALVVAKSKVEAAMKAGINLDGGAMIGRSNPDGIPEDDPLDLKARLQDSQDDIETLRAQLSLERQRCTMLHNELQDLSKEQADELSGAHAKQRQYERKISDLTTMVANLQSSLRRNTAPAAIMGEALLDANGDTTDASHTDEDYSGVQHSGDEKKETDHLRKQITSLSEKIFGMQSKIDAGRGEISTMKNRLRSALLRAETAEKSLEAANQRLIMMDSPMMSGMSSADEEMGVAGRKVARKRRPVGGAASSGSTRRQGFHKTSKVESIRSALGLHPGRFPTGGWQEMIASLLDTFDVLAVDLGSHFRHYPMSRLAFIMYMLVLHVWAFFLLVYHAHAQGTGDGDTHGPEALFNSYRHMEQIPKVAAAVTP
ncbi:hypothetical protein ACHAXR_008822 [Thalassiosira sp. AJA248-18]